MRYIWMIFVGLLLSMVAILPRLGKHQPAQPATDAPLADPALRAQPTALRTAAGTALPPRADSIVAFGLAQRGTPYVYAGTSPLTGFDCSGFIMYTFAHFGVPVPHSTALLIDVGRPVARAEAQPGDIVVFTGTAATSTTPGHAGIVISNRGELPMRFVHASSSRREPFVKVSQVENSDYERRFMQVRRVLGPGTGIVATARPKLLPAPASTPRVAALPARRVALEEVAEPVPALPQRLATKKYPTAATTAKRKATGKKPTVKATAKKVLVKTNVAAKKVSTAKRKLPARPVHTTATKRPAAKARK
ncbi:C40 family peptidase [Microvirga sp. STS02]|uniref:C40 family peptidase n=1 Tax=Hymenobacter negativus TaxID=2795026 RepID=UPI0018DBD0BA|nr:MULTISPECIES: C40 family peptidase [Bacteria]MBH8569173.1 C40 family peptidase [Hymenobacter negativus]MBR7208908.1 C40 family peptidase [Microvirga sp. STS02]